MCAARPSRRPRYPFDGPLPDYPVYLEDRVQQLERRNAELEKRNAELENELRGARSPLAQLTLFTPDEGSCPTFHIETLESQRAAIENSTTSTQKQPDESRIVNLLSRIPTSESAWSKRKEKTKLSTPEQILDLFQVLTLSPPMLTSLPCTEHTRSESETLEAYHHLAKYSVQLSNYSLLVFFCICLIARSSDNVPVKEINNLTIDLLGKKQDAAYLTRLRHAAGSIARVIEMLEAVLGHAGSMVFLLCCPSMSIYRKLDLGPTTLEKLVTRILEQMAWLQERPDNVPVSFSPAFLIAYSGIYSLDKVNNALGTKLTHEDYERRRQCVEREMAEFRPGEETVSRQPAKRRKTTNLRNSRSDLPSGGPTEQQAVPLEQEVARSESERPLSSASSDQSAPMSAETSAHDNRQSPHTASKDVSSRQLPLPLEVSNALDQHSISNTSSSSDNNHRENGLPLAVRPLAEQAEPNSADLSAVDLFAPLSAEDLYFPPSEQELQEIVDKQSNVDLDLDFEHLVFNMNAMVDIPFDLEAFQPPSQSQ